MTDEYHENSANSAWNGDSIQLMIANDAQDTQVALYNYALGGIETELGDVIVMHEAGPVADGDDNATQAIVKRNTDTKRTTYEIRLPKESLGLEKLGPGTQFGLGMAINDGDEATPGQKGWGGLGAHSIVFGKTPSETALVTLGVVSPTGGCFLSAISNDLDTVSFRGNDFEGCEVDPSATKLFINGIEVALVAKAATLGATDFTHTFDKPLPSGARVSVRIELGNSSGNPITEEVLITAENFAVFRPDMQARRVDKSKPGFVWRVFQNETYSTNSINDTELALIGELVDADGEPVDENFADESKEGPADGLGVVVGTAGLIEFQIPSVINVNTEAGGAAGNFLDDEQMPGVPGVNEFADGARVEVIFYAELPAGRSKWGVNSDDGFRMEGGPPELADAMGEFRTGRGPGNTTFEFEVEEPGIYPIRMIYFNGGGGGALEIFSEDAEGNRVLLNDLANGGIATYRSAPEEFLITSISRSGADISLTWQSKVGGYYAVDTSTDLVNWEAIITEIPAEGATEEATSFTDSGVPADTDALYYRVRQVPAPALYFTEFEDGAGGWSVETDGGSSDWELGTPAVDGLMAAASGTQAWGTVLDGNYTSELNLTRLRSPVIDVSSARSPRLSFNFFVDTTPEVEGCQLRILDENGEILFAQEGEDIFSGQSGGWTPTTIRFPAAARGVKVILEFAFLTDDDGDVGAGMYIDDVRID